jgi:hypothetical protein
VRLAVFALVLLAGCAASSSVERSSGAESLVGVTLTRDEVMRFGTHRYRAQPATVFRAAVGALRVLGYDIVSEAPTEGLILTGRKLVRVQANVWLGGATTYTRQFVVRLFNDAETHDVVVSALPKVFENEVDISERPVWDLRGERQIWASLYRQMDLMLQ